MLDSHCVGDWEWEEMNDIEREMYPENKKDRCAAS